MRPGALENCGWGRQQRWWERWTHSCISCVLEWSGGEIPAEPFTECINAERQGTCPPEASVASHSQGDKQQQPRKKELQSCIPVASPWPYSGGPKSERRARYRRNPFTLCCWSQSFWQEFEVELFNWLGWSLKYPHEPVLISEWPESYGI